MAIPLYLALSPAEFSSCADLPPKAAWMACHFSAGGDGLSNLPNALPAGSLLILDDSTPFQDHSLDLILSQLHDAVAAFSPEALLLDFQRPGAEQVARLASAIAAHPPCPVAISLCYAMTLDCPIFLPPGPLCKPLEAYLKPYRNRQIWLDAAPVCAQTVITPQSSTYLPQPVATLSDGCHFDASLHCHYHIKIEEDRIVFTLSRGRDDLDAWLQEAEALGVSCAVGLFQELCQIPLTALEKVL